MATLTLEINDETLMQLATAARAEGQDTTEYAASRLAQLFQDEEGDNNGVAEPLSANPRTLADDLNGLIGLGDSRNANPGELRPGDQHEAIFYRLMNEKFPRQETRLDLD